uniref:28s ribosomal protein mitochondrial n=1 Tax=Triatoma infestans TaxID=30076 RepID=A0A170XFC1_TRIIF
MNRASPLVFCCNYLSDPLSLQFLKVLFQPYAKQARFNHWTDWRMAKDVRKRKTLSEFAVSKLRVNALRKNDILPKEIREIADKEISEFPRDAVGIRIRSRCAITSRPNGNVLRWRVSRIVSEI